MLAVGETETIRQPSREVEDDGFVIGIICVIPGGDNERNPSCAGRNADDIIIEIFACRIGHQDCVVTDFGIGRRGNVNAEIKGFRQSSVDIDEHCCAP